MAERIDLLDSFRKLCETTVDHPSVARPLAFGAEGDVAYLVYADLAGTAMDAVMLQQGPRPVAEVFQRTKQIADAIDVAAGAGVHHGMLAPCDVILDGERTIVIGFGLAQALIGAAIPAEAESPYGSPQRLAGAPSTHADDIYSLAAIAIELLIGTPTDPEQASREAQGLPERRRVPRPAPHETRMFTTIAGVDAGKLRACFAAAFSEQPSARPSTASAFVESFLDAISNRRGTDEPVPGLVSIPSVNDIREDPPSAPASDVNRVEAKTTPDATPEPAARQDRVVPESRATRRRRARARRRERLATSQPLIPESDKGGQRERAPEGVARPEPIVKDTVLADVTPPRARSIDDPSHAIPFQSGSRAFLIAAVVVVSFSAGFGGGFVVGHFSKPSTESMNVSHDESVAEPQPTRAAVDPKPIASTTQTAASIPDEKVASSAAAATTVASQAAVPAVESGRLLVRSTPSGAAVTVDGQSRGVTPLALRELAYGAHTIEVSLAGHDTRQQRVTLSERRPARSVNFELRPTSLPAHATAATNATGSLQVASRPSGAQVFIDDNLIGTTPLLLSDVEAGSKHLRIELSGYKIWTTSVQVEPSGRARVTASLEP